MLTIHYNDEPFQRYLSALQDRLHDLTPVMSSIGQEMESRIQQRFETRSDPDGRPWAQWKESTRRTYPWPNSPAAKRAGRAGFGKLLERTGDMRSGLSWHADSHSVRVGFDRPYAKWHEVGTSHMKRRGLLASSNGRLSDADAQHVLALVQRLLQGQ